MREILLKCIVNCDRVKVPSAPEDCRNRTGCMNVSLSYVSENSKLSLLHVTHITKQEKLEMHVCRYVIMGVFVFL